MAAFIGFRVRGSGTVAVTIARKIHEVLAAHVPTEHIALAAADGFVIAFDDRSATQTEGRSGGCLVFGDLIVPQAETAAKDARQLVDAMAAGDDALASLLATTRGNFVALAWDFGGRLAVAGDCLATRPVYYACTSGGTFFTSQMRFWPELPLRRLDVDVDGALEEAVFDLPLGSRTVLSGVFALGAAEFFCVSITGLKRRRYFNWSGVSVSATHDDEDLADRAYAAFGEGVRARAGRRGASHCLLSGGMDSRVIAFVLAELGWAPTLLSFGLPDSQDLLIARQLALLLPGRHEVRELDFFSFADAGGVPRLAAAMIDDRLHNDYVRIWSGDGGSVGLGAVYLNDAMCYHAAAGAFEACAREHTVYNRAGPSARITVMPNHSRFAGDAVLRQLQAFTGSRRDLAPYVFLMLNDQRRHQYGYYEDILDSHVELLTPFLDFVFLKVVLECRLEGLLYHRFYSKFFTRLPASARSVAWQTYPGHVPCPLPLPKGSRSPWARIATQTSGDRRLWRMRSLRVGAAALTRRLAPLPLRRLSLAVLGAVGFAWPGRVRYHIGQADSLLRALAMTRRRPGAPLHIEAGPACGP